MPNAKSKFKVWYTIEDKYPHCFKVWALTENEVWNFINLHFPPGLKIIDVELMEG